MRIKSRGQVRARAYLLLVLVGVHCRHGDALVHDLVIELLRARLALYEDQHRRLYALQHSNTKVIEVTEQCRQRSRLHSY